MVNKYGARVSPWRTPARISYKTFWKTYIFKFEWIPKKESIKAPLYKSEKHTAKICSKKNVQQNKHEWKKKKKKKKDLNYNRTFKSSKKLKKLKFKA